MITNCSYKLSYSIFDRQFFIFRQDHLYNLLEYDFVLELFKYFKFFNS